MKKHYIKAVVDLLLQGKDADAVLSNLKRVLKNKGHERILGEILRGVAKELQYHKKAIASTVIVAGSKDAAVYKEAIEASLSALGGNLNDAQFITDQTLIGGYIASHQGKLINRSHKEKLVSLYRSITK